MSYVSGITRRAACYCRGRPNQCRGICGLGDGVRRFRGRRKDTSAEQALKTCGKHGQANLPRFGKVSRGDTAPAVLRPMSCQLQLLSHGPPVLLHAFPALNTVLARSRKPKRSAISNSRQPVRLGKKKPQPRTVGVSLLVGRRESNARPTNPYELLNCAPILSVRFSEIPPKIPP